MVFIFSLTYYCQNITSASCNTYAYHIRFEVVQFIPNNTKFSMKRLPFEDKKFSINCLESIWISYHCRFPQLYPSIRRFDELSQKLSKRSKRSPYYCSASKNDKKNLSCWVLSQSHQ